MEIEKKDKRIIKTVIATLVLLIAFFVQGAICRFDAWARRMTRFASGARGVRSAFSGRSTWNSFRRSRFFSSPDRSSVRRLMAEATRAFPSTRSEPVAVRSAGRTISAAAQPPGTDRRSSAVTARADAAAATRETSPI